MIKYEDKFVELYSDKDEKALHIAKVDSSAITQCPESSNLFVVGLYLLDIFNLSKGLENHLTCMILKKLASAIGGKATFGRGEFEYVKDFIHLPSRFSVQYLMPKLLVDKDTDVIQSMIKHQCLIHVIDGKNLLTSLYEL